jgi:hypothetical protein
MACKKVQVERPSCSTSGGQSEGMAEKEAFGLGGAGFAVFGGWC